MSTQQGAPIPPGGSRQRDLEEMRRLREAEQSSKSTASSSGTSATAPAMVTDEDDLLWRNRARMTVAVIALAGGIISVLLGLVPPVSGYRLWLVVAGLGQCAWAFMVWRRRRSVYRSGLVIAIIIAVIGLLLLIAGYANGLEIVVLYGLAAVGLRYSRVTFDR